MAATQFKTPSGDVVPVELLQQDSMVRASSGAPVRVAEIIVWPKALREIVELRVDSERLLVTSSHRVVIPSEKGEVEALAGALQLGQAVCCSDGTRMLSHVAKSFQEIEVFEILFDPDEPIEAWSPPIGAILTKGKCRPKILPTQVDNTIDVPKRTGFAKIVLLHVTRHPPALESALAQHRNLCAVRQALATAGLEYIGQTGAKVFVLPEEHSSATRSCYEMAASRGHNLGPQHIIVSEQFLPQVMEVMKSLRHKDNVRVKSKQTIVYVVNDGNHLATLVTRRTFLQAEYGTRDTKSVSNSTTVAHGAKNPRCSRLT